MFKTLIRTVFTIAGSIVGYGVYSMMKFISLLQGIRSWSIFGHTGRVPGCPLRSYIRTDLFPADAYAQEAGQQNGEQYRIRSAGRMCANEIVLGTIGLIAGLIIAFLISQIYVGIKIPYVDVILNIITYIHLGYIGIVVATRKGKDIRAAWMSSRKIPTGQGRGKQKPDATQDLRYKRYNRRQDRRYNENRIHRRYNSDT